MYILKNSQSLTGRFLLRLAKLVRKYGVTSEYPHTTKTTPFLITSYAFLRYLSHFQWLHVDVLRSLINNIIILIVQLVAGYGSFVASSHFLDYQCHNVYGRTCSWLRVTSGYELILSSDVIIFTVYPVAGYRSFVTSSRSRE